MLLDGRFRIVGHTPIFTQSGGTCTATICTVVGYKLVSDPGKSTKVRTSELTGVAKTVLEQYVARH